ncbi:MAG: beta-phosphoglucomutase family hydrolase [Gammaproteobacteria bacterium]|nr:beta-phosphoglucomutase family hydrolase [Gammaproteobacteria bacterium]
MFNGIKAIIFDMDGTLIDTGQLHELAWTKTLSHFDIPLDKALMRSLAGVPTIETLERLIQHFDCAQVAPLDHINEFKESYVANEIKNFVKPTPLIDIVRQANLNIPMTVGTGAYTQEAKTILSYCGLTAEIDHVVGADQVSNPKPAPDTFLRCAKLVGVASEHCLVFEDAQMGIQAAKAANMKVIDVQQELNIVNHYFL